MASKRSYESFSPDENTPKIARTPQTKLREYFLGQEFMERTTPDMEGTTLLSSKEIDRVPAIGNTDSDITLYVLGDIEGNIAHLYQWFLRMSLINEDLDWICPDQNVYVVQCGDQVDSARYSYATPDAQASVMRDSDVAVALFMEYLNHVSGGNVISLIGNHEWQNVLGFFESVHGVHNAWLNPVIRGKAFAFDGIIGRILRRRNFVARINKCLISHAGISPANIAMFTNMTKEKFDISNFLTKVNMESGIAANFSQNGVRDGSVQGTSPEWTPMFRNVVHGTMGDDGMFTGILWNRHYFPITMDPNGNMRDQTNAYSGVPIRAPLYLTDFVQIKGHDKSHEVWYCGIGKNLNEEIQTQCDVQPKATTYIVAADTTSGYHNTITHVKVTFRNRYNNPVFETVSVPADNNIHFGFNCTEIVKEFQARMDGGGGRAKKKYSQNVASKANGRQETKRGRRA